VLNRPPAVDSTHVSAIADALRQLIAYARMISEYEFEQSADICWIELFELHRLYPQIHHANLPQLLECANS